MINPLISLEESRVLASNEEKTPEHDVIIIEKKGKKFPKSRPVKEKDTLLKSLKKEITVKTSDLSIEIPGLSIKNQGSKRKKTPLVDEKEVALQLLYSRIDEAYLKAERLCGSYYMRCSRKDLDD